MTLTTKSSHLIRRKKTMTDHIFPPSLALRALSSGPYRNAAFAVSELIDNSADAKARFIAVALIVDGGSRPSEIAVLDDGTGMDRNLLRHCIQYGYGAAEGESQPSEGAKSRAGKRLGKFGVGLVAASFSQCSDLQVMSWQNEEIATGKVPATRLCLSDEDGIKDNVLPDTFDEKVPDWANLAFDGMPEPISAIKSGTLVVWRDVSTTHRRRAETLRMHICNLCGRIHRNRIQNKTLSILVNIFDKASNTIKASTFAPPVDPTFLTNWNENALEKDGFIGKETLFTPYTGHPGDAGKDIDGEYQPEMNEVKGPDGGVVGYYLITASHRKRWVAKDERFSTHYGDPGKAPFGKLADKLRGVSLMRSGREIELDPAWLRGDRTVDRWVSVSIDFDPDLDDVFGVSNDKQQVRGLSDLASTPLNEIKERLNELQEEGDLEEDWTIIRCLEVAKQIKERLQSMQRIVGNQRREARKKKMEMLPGDPYTPAVDELKQDGHALSAHGREMPMDSTKPSSDPEKTTEAYGDTLARGEPAQNLRPLEVMNNDLKLDYVLDPHGRSTEMFSFAVGPGHLIVKFHEKHPLSEAMARLIALGDGDVGDEGDSEDRGKQTALGGDDDSEGGNEDESERPSVEDALRVIRGLVASFVRSQAEADSLRKFEEVRALDLSLSLWSEKATHVLESEE